MAFIPIPNSATLCFHFVTAGQNWQFCLTIRKVSGSPTPADLATLVSAGHTWFAADLKPLLYSATELRTITATDQTYQGAPQASGSYTEAGTATGGIIPVGTPIVASFRTALRGRSYRGRAYISGTSSTNYTDSAHISSAMAASLGATMASFGGAMSAVGWTHVVASKQHNGVATNPAVTNPVTNVVVDTNLDSQRRRLAGRGT